MTGKTYWWAQENSRIKIFANTTTRKVADLNTEEFRFTGWNAKKLILLFAFQ